MRKEDRVGVFLFFWLYYEIFTMVLSLCSIFDNNKWYYWRLVIVGYTLLTLLDVFFSIILLSGIDSIKFMMKNYDLKTVENIAASYLHRKDAQAEIKEIQN